MTPNRESPGTIVLNCNGPVNINELRLNGGIGSIQSCPAGAGGNGTSGAGGNGGGVLSPGNGSPGGTIVINGSGTVTIGSIEAIGGDAGTGIALSAGPGGNGSIGGAAGNIGSLLVPFAPPGGARGTTTNVLASGNGGTGGVVIFNTPNANVTVQGDIKTMGGSNNGLFLGTAGGSATVSAGGAGTSIAGFGNAGAAGFISINARSLILQGNVENSGGCHCLAALAGDGGSGALAGGIGGSVGSAGVTSAGNGGAVTITTTNGVDLQGSIHADAGSISAQLQSGAGGDATANNGTGGASGSIKNLFIPGSIAGAITIIGGTGGITGGGTISARGGDSQFAAAVGRGGDGFGTGASSGGSTGTVMFGPGNAGMAGAITLVATGTGNITPSVSADGGNVQYAVMIDRGGDAGTGGNGSGGNSANAPGGGLASRGGSIFISTASGTASSTVSATGGSVDIFFDIGRGGNGQGNGNGGSSGSTGDTLSAGTGGTIIVSTISGSVTGQFDASGGLGPGVTDNIGAGGHSGSTGGIGGNGGSIGNTGGGGSGGLIQITSASGNITPATLTATGNVGGSLCCVTAGNGGSGFNSGGSGGSIGTTAGGGNGGTIFLSTTNGTISLTQPVQTTGGLSADVTATSGSGASTTNGSAGNAGNIGSIAGSGNGGIITMIAKAITTTDLDASAGGFIPASISFGDPGASTTGKAGNGASLGNSGPMGNGGTITLISTGLITISGATNVSGGNCDTAASLNYSPNTPAPSTLGSNAGSIGNASSGGNGGTININSGSFVHTSAAEILALGGNGQPLSVTLQNGGAATAANTIGGTGGSAGATGSGGNGGSVLIAASTSVNIQTAIRTNGGTAGSGQAIQAGNGGDGTFSGGAGGSIGPLGSGGNAGTVSISSATLSLQDIQADGGSSTIFANMTAAGNGGNGTVQGGSGGSIAIGGHGGNGGHIVLTATGAAQLLGPSAWTAIGGTIAPPLGTAGNGGNGQIAGAGGSVGSAAFTGLGGSVFVSASSFSQLDSAAKIDVSAASPTDPSSRSANGGNGGQGIGPGSIGGAGGSIGSLGLALPAGSITITTSGANGIAVAGILTARGSSNNYSSYSITGGSGGSGSSNGGLGGNVGAAYLAGMAGTIVLNSAAAGISISNQIDVSGGSAGTYNGTTGAGGNATAGIGGNSGFALAGGLAGPGGQLSALASGAGQIQLTGQIVGTGGTGLNNTMRTANGGTGSTGGASGFIGSTGNAANGATLNVTASSGNVSVNTVNLQGGLVSDNSGTTGNGGNGTSGAGGSSGFVGNGGIAGNGGTLTITTAGQVTIASIDLSGGAISNYAPTTGSGGNSTSGPGGRSGDIAAAGFSSGNGGSLSINAGSINLTSARSTGGTVSLSVPTFGTGNGGSSTTGSGGSAGNVGNSANSGRGGALSLIANGAITTSMLDVSGGLQTGTYNPVAGNGGSGSIGGNGGSTGAAGRGGNGGSIFLQTASTNQNTSSIVTNGQAAQTNSAVAGNGGAGNVAGGNGGSVGPSQNGGTAGNITLIAAQNNFSGTTYNSNGGSGGIQQGRGGTGGNATGPGGSGGNVGGSGSGGNGATVRITLPRSINTWNVAGGTAGSQNGIVGTGGSGSPAGLNGTFGPTGTNGLNGSLISEGEEDDTTTNDNRRLRTRSTHIKLALDALPDNLQQAEPLSPVAFYQSMPTLQQCSPQLKGVPLLCDPVLSPAINEALRSHAQFKVQPEGTIFLSSGALLLAPRKHTAVIETRLGTVQIDRGSKVLVEVNSGALAIYNLLDNGTGRVRAIVSTNPRQPIEVAMGKQLVISESQTDDLLAAAPCSNIAVRKISVTRLTSGQRIFVADFSIPSALMNHTALKGLLGTNDRTLTKQLSPILKSAAVLTFVNGTSLGAYRHK